MGMLQLVSCNFTGPVKSIRYQGLDYRDYLRCLIFGFLQGLKASDERPQQSCSPPPLQDIAIAPPRLSPALVSRA